MNLFLNSEAESVFAHYWFISDCWKVWAAPMFCWSIN